MEQVSKSDSFDDKLIAFVRKAQEDAAAIDRVRELLSEYVDEDGDYLDSVAERFAHALDA